MSRRASSNSNLIIFVIIGVVLIAAFGVGVTFMNKAKTPFSKLSSLPIEDAVSNGNSLRGNSYKISGTIEERWVKDKAEGVFLSVEENGAKNCLFIVIPSDLDRPNLERQRKYAFSLKVIEGGLLEANAIETL